MTLKWEKKLCIFKPSFETMYEGPSKLFVYMKFSSVVVVNVCVCVEFSKVLIENQLSSVHKLSKVLNSLGL